MHINNLNWLFISRYAVTTYFDLFQATGFTRCTCFFLTYSGKFHFVAVRLVLVEIPRCLNSIALTGKYLRNALKLSRRNRAEKNLILCLAHQKLHRVNDPSIGFE